MIRRRKRKVRLHLDGMDSSLEGIFVGFWANHYILRVPAMVEAADRSVALDGNVRVPRERVIFVQEL